MSSKLVGCKNKNVKKDLSTEKTFHPRVKLFTIPNENLA